MKGSYMEVSPSDLSDTISFTVTDYSTNAEIFGKLLFKNDRRLTYFEPNEETHINTVYAGGSYDFRRGH